MDLNVFPAKDAQGETWVRWCEENLSLFDKETSHDPLANGVRSLAYSLSQGLASGAIQAPIMKDIVAQLCNRAVSARIGRFAAIHTHTIESARKLIFDALDKAAFKTIDEFKEGLSRNSAGVVFTAHPTFAMPKEMRDAFADLASAGAAPSADKTNAALQNMRHLPDEPLTLHKEHEESQTSIANAQTALRFLRQTICEWAEKTFAGAQPNDMPNPVSLATWVGYDLDGRNDIHWGQTFRLRLEEKATQLERYAEAILAIKSGDHSEDLKKIAAELKNASKLAYSQAELFAHDLDDPANVVRAANALTAPHPNRLTSLANVRSDIQKIIAASDTLDVKRSLHQVCDEMSAYGLGVARIHLRVNAAQVRSTLRADLDLKKGEEFSNRTILATAAERSSSVTVRNVNMATVFSEKMTARRQFMMCAQFKKHVDEETPIRFLIAECEAPATVMGAVFLARLYGVDDIVDISPLFETPEAIERGGRFMERLLDEKEFVSYIRKRGRVAIQLGFSDSGRFMGQIAADLAIERLHILLARALAARDIRDVEVVLFNTHGESMGRGAFPGGFNERFNHLLTPWTRSRYVHEGIKINAESSFQGGDGFLHFQTPQLARSTVAQIFVWALSPDVSKKDDTFYTDINFSWDFYRGVKSWQEALFENTDYHVALTAFSPNLLVKTGSRKVRRQSADPTIAASPRSMRAIPNNAILQGLNAPANVYGGIGMAAGLEAERFSKWRHGSKRVEGIESYARYARRLTDLGVLRAYASLYDASFWSIQPDGSCPAPGRPHAIIASRLADQRVSTAMTRLANHFSRDLQYFDRLFEINDAADQEEKACLRLLHAVRIALIMEAFRLVGTAPSFSRRHDISYNALVDLALRLEFDALADLLSEIFPLAESNADALAGVEEASDANEMLTEGYPEIHRTIINPLREISKTVLECGVGIAHHYNAFG